MSYKQSILRDDPISFWPLDGESTLRTYATLLLEYATYQDYLNNESSYLKELGSVTIQDVSNFGNHASFTLGSPNFQDVMTLVTHASYDTNLSGCKITENIGVDVLNLYGAFQKGNEQQAFGIEFWALIPTVQNTQFNIMDLHAGANQRMQIYIQNDSIYFKIYFSNGTSVTTRKQVYSWDEPIHVFAVTKDRNINIYVNGITDETITFDKSLTYYSDQYTRFGVGPASAGKYFTVNDLAFYDRKLSVNEIKNHMFWAHRDSSPIMHSNQTDVSHFSFDKTTGQSIFSKQFNNQFAYNEGTLSNIVTDLTGITLPKTTSSTPAIGTWTYSFAISSYSNFAGIELSWDTGSYNVSGSDNYITVSVSYDGGTTYYPVTNKRNFPYFLSSYTSALSGQGLIKVTLYSSDTSTGDQPRIDNLAIDLYSSITEISDSGLFQIYPASSTTYMIKKDDSNILSRSTNLGIRFSAQDPGSKPGYAIISPINNATYQSVEFWMRYDGSGSAILDTSVSPTDLYIDQYNVLQNTVSGSTLYVNGVNRNSSPITLSNGEVYHVVLVYSTAQSNNILLNGSYDVSVYPSEASYGYITLYPTATNLSTVQSRYLSFIAVQTGVARDSVTSIGSIIEYSGTSSQINNGDAVIYHTHI